MENEMETREYVAFILALYPDRKREGNYCTGLYRVYIRVVQGFR